MVSSGAQGFSDLVSIGDCIEKGLKNGKILSNVGATSAQEKYFGDFQKKKKGETSTIYINQGRNRQRRPQQPLTYQHPLVHVSYYPPSYIVAIAPAYSQALPHAYAVYP